MKSTQRQTPEPTESMRVSALAELPPPDTVRWVARRKAQVVRAVRDGVLTLDDACERYSLSVEEFCAWQRRFECAGVRGLRARTRSPV